MTRNIILIFVIGFFLYSCQNDATNTAADSNGSTASSQNDSKTQASNAETTTDRLLKGKEGNAEASKIISKIGAMIGSSMLESVDYTNGQLSLKYFDNADAFNAANGESRMSMNPSTFTKYWKAGARAEKVLSAISADMLYNFDFVKSVNVSLTDGEKNITASVSREQLSQLTGKSWEDLKKDWVSSYTNSFVRIPEGRAKFMKELTK